MVTASYQPVSHQPSRKQQSDERLAARRDAGSDEGLTSKCLALFGFRGHLEIDACFFVGFLGGGQIQVGEQDLARAAFSKVKQGVADDGVIDYVGMVSIFEDKDSGR